MVISTHNIATGDGLYRAAAWAVLVRMSCDSVVVIVAISIVLESGIYRLFIYVLHIVCLQGTGEYI